MLCTPQLSVGTKWKNLMNFGLVGLVFQWCSSILFSHWGGQVWDPRAWGHPQPLWALLWSLQTVLQFPGHSHGLWTLLWSLQSSGHPHSLWTLLSAGAGSDGLNISLVLLQLLLVSVP